MGHIGQGFFTGAFVATDLLGIVAVQVRTEGGDLNHLVVAPAPVHHVHDAKASADDESASKTRFDFFGCGVSGYIKIFGL